MSNLSEHPLVVDFNARFQETENDYVGCTILLPGMPNLVGELRKGVVEGGFLLTTNIRLGEGGQVGRVDFSFAADKAIAIIYPSAQQVPEESLIVKPH